MICPFHVFKGHSHRRPATILVSGILAAAACLAQNSPSVFSTSPSSVVAGSPAFTLFVNGANFVTGAFTTWNGVPLQTSVASSVQVTALVPSNLIAAPGFATIVVINPGGIASNSVGFTITTAEITISTTSLPGGTVGTAYSATLAATGGTPPYTWSATSALPPGLSLSSSGSISGTPTTAGNYNVTIRVADTKQVLATQSFALTIAGAAFSITTSSPLTAGTIGQPYSQTLTAAGGQAPYSWTLGTGAPPGLTIAAATGVLSGTPTSAGTFSFAVQVTDANHLSATQNFSLTINPAPLTITTVPPLFNGTVGTPYSQTFSASGGAPPYQWAIVAGDAGGLTLDASSGTLQGTPQNAGTFNFTVQVSDTRSAKVSQAFSVTVTAPALTIVTGASLPDGTVGVAYSQQFSVVGGVPPYTWTLASGNVPGLTFDASHATLSGTPTTPGSFSFTLQAHDSGGLSTSRAFTLTIGPAQLTIASPTQLPDGTLGAAYSYQMTAAGGVPPYTWSANGLPDGLNINSVTGIISGTVNAVGPAPFAVRVIDSARASATNQFRINVALPHVPNVTISGLPASVGPAQQFTLSISLDSTFPVAITGQAILSFSPEVGGGDNTIQFSSGGTTASFSIPAGSTAASSTLAIQTGTVAGTISVSLRLSAGGQDVTPSPAPTVTTHLDQAAPVIRSTSVSRSSTGISIQITGFSTAREVTQATFTFTAAAGQSLQPGASQITVSLDTLFGSWFQNPANNDYGSQFVLTQPFSVQGDPTAVLPQSVTLTNRKGTVTASLSQSQ